MTGNKEREVKEGEVLSPLPWQTSNILCSVHPSEKRWGGDSRGWEVNEREGKVGVKNEKCGKGSVRELREGMNRGTLGRKSWDGAGWEGLLGPGRGHVNIKSMSRAPDWRIVG